MQTSSLNSIKIGNFRSNDDSFTQIYLNLAKNLLQGLCMLLFRPLKQGHPYFIGFALQVHDHL